MLQAEILSQHGQPHSTHTSQISVVLLTVTTTSNGNQKVMYCNQNCAKHAQQSILYAFTSTCNAPSPRGNIPSTVGTSNLHLLPYEWLCTPYCSHNSRQGYLHSDLLLRPSTPWGDCPVQAPAPPSSQSNSIAHSMHYMSGVHPSGPAFLLRRHNTSCAENRRSAGWRHSALRTRRRCDLQQCALRHVLIARGTPLCMGNPSDADTPPTALPFYVARLIVAAALAAAATG